MNSSPLISVIIPCYNAERFIAETLRSIFAQTFQDFEVIAIDDGSTDDTSSIIRTYDQKIHAEFSEKRGASAARNRGTELAKGAFIQYVDADDLLCSDSLAKRVAALQESNADVLVLDVRELSEYEAGHIPGVTLMPVGEVASRLNEIPEDKPVIVTCRSGNRSGQVANFLREQGYENIHNMQGGILAWEAAGLAVER